MRVPLTPQCDPPPPTPDPQIQTRGSPCVTPTRVCARKKNFKKNFARNKKKTKFQNENYPWGSIPKENENGRKKNFGAQNTLAREKKKQKHKCDPPPPKMHPGTAP